MKINYLGNRFYKEYELISHDNPFKRGSIQYYLINYLKKNTNENNIIKNINSNDLVKYISKLKNIELGLLSQWNLENIYDNTIELGLHNNIIKYKSSDNKFFGLYFEDGLIDVLSNEKYTEHLPIGKISSNHKLLWLSLYMNKNIRDKNKVINVKLSDETKYHSSNFTINFENFNYSKLTDTTIEIPFSAYSQPWHSKEWICLESRGLFHHIGDNISFFYGANQYLDCYFIGRNQYNQISILSDNYAYNKENIKLLHNTNNRNSIYQYSNKNVDDLLYAYGVTTGQSKIGNNEYINKNYVKECVMNDYDNYYNVEKYWENDVFLNNANREMNVMSIQEKFIEILEKIKVHYNETNKIVINKIINNQKINKKDIELLEEEFKKFEALTEKDETFFIK